MADKAKFNIIYSMKLAPGGIFARYISPSSSRIRFMLAFHLGERLGNISFGSNLDSVEQMTSNLDDRVKMQALQLRESIQSNIQDIELLSVTATSDVLNSRTVTF